MDKRYQVFVSSTYRDLANEREEVMRALLELDCIPAGMELFPASDDDQWKLIRRVIDVCDYYLVIVGGRYGSLDASGISYTEKEYDYAVSIGLPILGFVHAKPNEIPAGKSELNSDAQVRLKTFREKVESRMVKHWSTAEELGAKVSRSLIVTFKTHPRPGWVRAENVGDPAAIAKLRLRIEELEEQLSAARTSPPSGTESLSQGDDEVELALWYETGPDDEDRELRRQKWTWNALFAWVGHLMLTDTSEADLRKRLNRLLDEPELTTASWLHPDSFQSVLIQFKALNLISLTSATGSDRYWKLTPYGETALLRLLAVHKGETRPKGSLLAD